MQETAAGKAPAEEALAIVAKQPDEAPSSPAYSPLSPPWDPCAEQAAAEDEQPDEAPSSPAYSPLSPPWDPCAEQAAAEDEQPDEAPSSPAYSPLSPAYHSRTGRRLQGNISGDEAAPLSAEDCLRMLEGEPGTNPFWLSDRICAT